MRREVWVGIRYAGNLWVHASLVSRKTSGLIVMAVWMSCGKVSKFLYWVCFKMSNQVLWCELVSLRTAVLYKVVISYVSLLEFVVGDSHDYRYDLCSWRTTGSVRYRSWIAIWIILSIRKAVLCWRGYVDNGDKMASSHRQMLLVGILLGLACSLSLTKLLLCVFAEISPGVGDKTEADIWLQENDLQQYQSYFRERGM